jgi:hypothetical protein
MPEDYRVNKGDCMSSIAYKHGFFWETLWNEPKNSAIKSKRKDPNVLQEGDVIHILDLRIKEESCATEKKHKFQLKGVPAKLKVRMMKKGKPRKDVKYRLIIDGIAHEGKTNGDGFIEHPLPPDAREGRLTLDEGNQQDVFIFNLGHVDPPDIDQGVAGRLHGLGYSTANGLPGAIKKFQADNGLQVTGHMDDNTRNKLKENFGQ